eukprot:1038550-Pelagomonas_calceolata.AAC.1
MRFGDSSRGCHQILGWRGYQDQNYWLGDLVDVLVSPSQRLLHGSTGQDAFAAFQPFPIWDAM